jgi:hypothetical protein
MPSADVVSDSYDITEANKSVSTPLNSPPKIAATPLTPLSPSPTTNVTTPFPSTPSTTTPLSSSVKKDRKLSVTLSGQMLPLLVVGERVKAKLGGGARYFPAIITQVRFNGKAYDLQYDDSGGSGVDSPGGSGSGGFKEKMVKREMIRSLDEAREALEKGGEGDGGAAPRALSLEALAGL